MTNGIEIPPQWMALPVLGPPDDFEWCRLCPYQDFVVVHQLAKQVQLIELISRSHALPAQPVIRRRVGCDLQRTGIGNRCAALTAHWAGFLHSHSYLLI